ncbi:MAG: hypothetical protein IT383_15935 [Deltaproteobacteria bacterium]|nr:hypothetical protein [Deltaproteobacteria bacterium]
MTEHKKLTPDDARALLSDHLEGALDGERQAELDALLAADPALAAERRRLEQTLTLLRGLPTPEGPSELVAKVRDRLAADRRAAQAPLPPAVDEVLPLARRRFGGAAWVAGLALAAGVALVVGVVGLPGQGATGTEAAGLGGQSVATTTVVAPGFAPALVADLAATAGLVAVEGGFEGDRKAAARFVLALKGAAVARGVEVTAMLPDTERVRVVVQGAR